MHSTEPLDPVEPQRTAPEDESWRAEVASRVNSYRARHKQAAVAQKVVPGAEPGLEQSSEQGSLALDLNLAAVPNAGKPDSVLCGDQSPAAPARSAAPGRNPVRNAFDTNYYRRRNAESLAAPALNMFASMETTVLAATPAPGAASVADAIPGVEHEDQPSLNLELRPAVTADANLDRYRISPATEVEAESASAPCVEQRPAAPAQSNLIVFRRPLIEPPLVQPPSRDELAEPVSHRPRILEVPEDIMPPVQGSLFPEIRLDADEPELPTRREPEIEVPLRVAPCSLRLSASLVDLGVVAAAGVLFAAIAWSALPGVPHTKPFWMVLGAVAMLFWAIYQHLFLLYAGRTLGMSLRGIHLRTFDGHVPQWSQRRRRARFMFISFVSVALGFLWALVDEDALCWHDRISQTFPTTE